ncbi:hypothetical protein RyT2_02930 [Pseudolactococcus yaeyamensis]
MFSEVSGFQLSQSSKEIAKNLLISVISAFLAVFVVRNFLIGAALCVSISTVARWVWAIYQAHRAGRSIRAAVSLCLGTAGWTWILVDFLIGYGVALVLGSTWVQAL